MKSWKKPIINSLAVNDIKDYVRAAAWSGGCRIHYRSF